MNCIFSIRQEFRALDTNLLHYSRFVCHLGQQSRRYATDVYPQLSLETRWHVKAFKGSVALGVKTKTLLKHSLHPPWIPFPQPTFCMRVKIIIKNGRTARKKISNCNFRITDYWLALLVSELFSWNNAWSFWFIHKIKFWVWNNDGHTMQHLHWMKQLQALCGKFWHYIAYNILCEGVHSGINRFCSCTMQ